MHLYSYLSLDACAVQFIYGLIVYIIEINLFSLTALLFLFGNKTFMVNF